MRIASEIRERLRALFHRSRGEGEMEAELRFHIEMQTEENLRRGMAPEEARRQAALAFGGVERVKEEVRDARGFGALEDTLRDLRYAARRLVREPGFTVPLIATLALGIGVTTAIFSVVDATLLRPLPFAQDDRLVVLSGVQVEALRIPGVPKGAPEISELDSLGHVFSRVAAYAPGGFNLAGAGDPMRAAVTLVTPSFFSTLGVVPSYGRPFTAEEGAPEHAQVAILSYGIWRTRYGADPGVIGRTIRLNGVPHRVIGVMPRGFAFPGETEVWIPYPIPMSNWGSEAFQSIRIPQVVARLAPNMTPEQAGERLLTLVQRYRPSAGPTPGTPRLDLVRPLRDDLVENRRTALWMLMGASGLMLLIACTNAANLLLSRAARRQREIVMRLMLGATGGRLLRQLLTESLVLALAGGVLGLLVAHAGTGVLQVLVPESLAGTTPPTLNGRVFLFAAAVALSSGVAAGIWPALRARTLDVADAVRSGPGSGMTLREGRRLRRLFIVTEFALALVLLTGAGVLVRSFQAVLATDPGLKPAQVATAQISLSKVRYGDVVARRQFYGEVLERLRAMPDLEAAAVVDQLPLRGGPEAAFLVSAEGKPPEPGAERVYAQGLQATPGYFAALGIPLLRGHAAVASPDSSGSKEVVIDQELARELWPGEDPIGKRLVGPDEKPRTVTGVVGNVRAQALDQDHVSAQMYVPLADDPSSDATLVVRSRIRPEALVARLREVVRAVDPEQPVYNAHTMEEVIAQAIAPRRTTALLVAAFGVLAVLLAGIGIYGVISFGVVQRRPEFGIRMALGARSGAIVRKVIGEGLVLAGVGTVLGLAGAWFLVRVLQGLVYGVVARDPFSFLIAPLILLGIAVLAALVPARMAARVEPLEALRAE